MSDLIIQDGEQITFTDGHPWTILNPIERSIKEKIEKIGTPLKDWKDISINYGIKTGCNEAFIIDEIKRNEILNNCKTEEERIKTAEIIRPILRGRDIKRYGYEWDGLYVIIAKYGSYNYLEKDYPSIFQHLKQYENKLKQRGQCRYTSGGKIHLEKPYPGQHHWLELDNNPSQSYMEEFFKPKIVYPCIMANEPCFMYDKSQYFAIAPGNIITGTYLKYLLAFLCSKTCYFALRKYYMGGGIDGELKTNRLLLLPIPKPVKNTNIVESLVEKFLLYKDKNINNEIDRYIYKAFDFNEEEIKFIESQIDK